MNEIVLKQNKLTSLQLAEITGKTHSHILRDIRNMEKAWYFITGTKFGFSEYLDASGKKNPMFELSMLESLYIATKFNDKDRAKLIMRWFELEKESLNKLQLEEKSGMPYAEKTMITVKMGRLSNQIYVNKGEIFAKFAPIARYLGYESAPTYFLSHLEPCNYCKLNIGRHEAWFINVKAFDELIKLKRNIPFGTIQTIYKDIFRIDKRSDTNNPYTFSFTDSEMLEIVMQLNKKPLRKSVIVELIYKGKK